MSQNLIKKLVEQLNKIPKSESELSALEAAGWLKPVMSLAEILEHQDALTAAYENDSEELMKTERAVRRCLKLPAVPLTKHVPLGF